MRILLVFQNWMGDALFATPCLALIKRKYPDSIVEALIHPRVKDVLAHNPHINSFIEVPDKLSFSEYSQLFFRIQKKRYDCAIFFSKSSSKARITAWAGIPQRIGLTHHRQKQLLTNALSVDYLKVHKTDAFLQLLTPLDINVEDADKTPQFIIDESRVATWKQNNPGLFEALSHDGYVVIHPGGNWLLKQWPTRYFAELARQYLRHYQGRVVLIGTKVESSLSQEIADLCSSERVINLCAKTDLNSLAYLMKHALAVISNDSGPIHLAASQTSRIVGLFGPTDPDLTGPHIKAPAKTLRLDVGCLVPCYFQRCDQRDCMNLLGPEKVYEALTQVISA